MQNSALLQLLQYMMAQSTLFIVLVATLLINVLSRLLHSQPVMKMFCRGPLHCNFGEKWKLTKSWKVSSHVHKQGHTMWFYTQHICDVHVFLVCFTCAQFSHDWNTIMMSQFSHPPNYINSLTCSLAVILTHDGTAGIIQCSWSSTAH